MPQRDVTLTNDVGLHARPAAMFVKAASGFDAAVTVEKDDRSANGKSLLSVLKLDVRQGDTVTISAEGADAEAAVEALADVVEAL